MFSWSFGLLTTRVLQRIGLLVLSPLIIRTGLCLDPKSKQDPGHNGLLEVFDHYFTYCWGLGRNLHAGAPSLSAGKPEDQLRILSV